MRLLLSFLLAAPASCSLLNESATTLQSSADPCAAKLDCGSCLDESADDACFWCYSTATCTSITWTPLPSFGGCKDLTFDAPTCHCRPSVYTTCDTCAQAAHPECVWLANATVEMSLSLTPPGGSPIVVPIPSAPLGARCVNGNGFGPDGLIVNRTYELPLLGSLSTGLAIKPIDWYWAQCTLPRWSLAAIILGSCLLCGCGCCLYHGRRTRRRRAHQVQFVGAGGALLQNGSLDG